jgi:hypothetical protein
MNIKQAYVFIRKVLEILYRILNKNSQNHPRFC